MKKIILLTAVMFNVTACLSSKEYKPVVPVPKPETETTPFDVITWSELIGTWRTNCLTSSIGNFVKHEALFVEASDSVKTLVFVDEYFDDSSCSQKLYSVQTQASVSLERNASSAAREMDLQIQSVFAAVLSDNGHLELQGDSECNLEWVEDGMEEITGLSCDKFGEIPSKDTRIFDLVGKAEGGIVFGKNDEELDGLTANGRPKFLSDSPIFLRIKD